MEKPTLIIHGGAGRRARNKKLDEEIEWHLARIIENSYQVLLQTGSSQKAVVHAISLLENCPLFNAGKGSAIQRDGVIRMSAGLMTGENLRFAGTVNVRGVKNPIQLAEKLLPQRFRVLDSHGSKIFANENDLALGNPYSRRAQLRLQEFLKKYDTVGAVALDAKGRITAGTSTGGMTGATAGRVSDSPTVSGNYANEWAGISATGVGEQITDHAVCAAIATRVEDGMNLEKAVEKTLDKAQRFKADFGLIALDRKGHWVADKTSKSMAWAVKSPTDCQIHPW